MVTRANDIGYGPEILDAYKLIGPLNISWVCECSSKNTFVYDLLSDTVEYRYACRLCPRPRTLEDILDGLAVAETLDHFVRMCRIVGMGAIDVEAIGGSAYWREAYESGLSPVQAVRGFDGRDER